MSRVVNWARRIQGQRRELSNPTSHIDALPNELLLAILALLDSSSLHRLAAVTKRFYELATHVLLAFHAIDLSVDTTGTGTVSCFSTTALRALRLGLALNLETKTKIMKRFVYIESLSQHNTGRIGQNVHQLKALLRRFSTRSTRLHSITLHFATDLITGWSIGTTPKLLQALCGASEKAVFVLREGLFTCRVPDLRYWNPHAKHALTTKMHFHDGSWQVAPTIRSITTLHAQYPICAGLSPYHPWTLVVVDQLLITTLTLAVKFKAHEWTAILGDAALTLPNLDTVEVLGNTGVPVSIEPFLNRHRLKAITFLSQHSIAEPDRLPPAVPLIQPVLERVSALAHYIKHIFPDHSSASTFPVLTHVEIWPDEYLSVALARLGAHSTLRSLVLHLFADAHFPKAENHQQWPIFPLVESLAIDKCRFASGFTSATAERLAVFIAHWFPALHMLTVSFDNGHRVSNLDRDKASDFARLVRQENPGITYCCIEATELFF
ncbi:hypothetical protein C8F01DRAFT_1126470 [Mycena amicta]|nr:hypothetical protein C8F01DRAFT_1126470 [Mycena amicta]